MDGQPQVYGDYDHDDVSTAVRNAYDMDATYDDDEQIECRDCGWTGGDDE